MYMYLDFCNVLHIWSIRAIPTYRVYRLYDATQGGIVVGLCGIRKAWSLHISLVWPIKMVILSSALEQRFVATICNFIGSIIDTDDC